MPGVQTHATGSPKRWISGDSAAFRAAVVAVLLLGGISLLTDGTELLEVFYPTVINQTVNFTGERTNFLNTSYFYNDIVVDDEVKILTNGTFWTYGSSTSYYGVFGIVNDVLNIYTHVGGSIILGTAISGNLILGFVNIVPDIPGTAFNAIFGNSTHRFKGSWFGFGDFSQNVSVGENVNIAVDINATNNTLSDCNWQGDATAGDYCNEDRIMAGYNDSNKELYCCEI